MYGLIRCIFHLLIFFVISTKRSLNSALEVKKWIPGIKKELDYYLDVSRHYVNLVYVCYTPFIN